MTPGRHPAKWKQPPQATPMRQITLVCCKVHKAHLVAAATFATHTNA